MGYKIFNEDCILSDKIEDNSVDLMVCDPPFGIGERTFSKHYKRNATNIIDGYVEAPKNYLEFSKSWIEKANRLMKPDSSIYIISGFTNLVDILLAASYQKDLVLTNHVIWKYNFGVYTKTKFVSSHYHILYYRKGNPVFNRFCRFGPTEKDSNGKSLNYADMEDVWYIKKEYHPNKKKNENKLPDSLIEKILLYSSNPNDVVCDFFMGNFTTAYMSIKLGRNPIGFELNSDAYEYHMPLLDSLEFGHGINELKKVEVLLPENQGKKITNEEWISIYEDYNVLMKSGFNKKTIIENLCSKYGRGKFSIINILDKLNSIQ